jgi:pimeloyl-ACP methyl ester carboxylesterase
MHPFHASHRQRKPIPLEALQQIDVPLLIIQGDACEPFPLEAANEWLQAIPNAQLHVVQGALDVHRTLCTRSVADTRPGGSHGLALTHADECNAAATRHYLSHSLQLKEASRPVASDFKVDRTPYDLDEAR